MSERQHSELCDCHECEAYKAFTEHEKMLSVIDDELAKPAEIKTPAVRDNEHHIEDMLIEADARADYDTAFKNQLINDALDAEELFPLDELEEHAAELTDYEYDGFAEAEADAYHSQWD